MFVYELGEVLKDIVTGYEGVVMARTDYLTGCNHYGLLKQKLGKEGKPEDWQWFDEKRLVKVPKKKKIELESRQNNEEGPGGPAPTPPER